MVFAPCIKQRNAHIPMSHSQQLPRPPKGFLVLQTSDSYSGAETLISLPNQCTLLHKTEHITTSTSILYHSILLHITYLFLLVIICLTNNLFLKILKVKISSTSLVYEHYMFQPTLVIFRCLYNCTLIREFMGVCLHLQIHLFVICISILYWYCVWFVLVFLVVYLYMCLTYGYG
jgi:hypothetical protein